MARQGKHSVALRVRAITARVLTPMEPVDPRMQTCCRAYSETHQQKAEGEGRSRRTQAVEAIEEPAVARKQGTGVLHPADSA
jgi:hypothetical protein